MQLLLKSALPSCAAADSGRLSCADAPGVNAVYTPPASAGAATMRTAAPTRRRARLGADLRRRNTRKRRPAGVSEVMGSVLWGFDVLWGSILGTGGAAAHGYCSQ